MISGKSSGQVLLGLALLAVVVGVLSLIGVRPFNNRTIEIVLGTASVIAGLALVSLTLRRHPQAVRRRSRS